MRDACGCPAQGTWNYIALAPCSVVLTAVLPTSNQISPRMERNLRPGAVSASADDCGVSFLPSQTNKEIHASRGAALVWSRLLRSHRRLWGISRRGMA